MADTNDLLHQIRTIVREENEPLKQGQAELKQGQKQLEQRQNEQGSTLAQIKTVVEATAAGVKELQETVATKADGLQVSVKVDKLRKRIEGIEEQTGSTTHKN